MKNLKYVLLLLLLPCLALGRTGLPAAVTDTIDPLNELLKIDEFYQSAAETYYGSLKDLYFHFNYKETDKDPCFETVIKENDVNLRTYGTKLWMEFVGDKTLVQDSLYCLSVNNNDSSIMIFSPSLLHKHLLGIDLFDPSLYDGQIRSMAVTDSTDALSGAGLRKIKVLFNMESQYIAYQVVYDTTYYSLWNVQYYIRKDMAEPGTPYSMPSAYLKYELKSTGHDALDEEIDHAVFTTNRFFRKRQGQYEPLAPYIEYLIINNTFQ